MDSKNRILWIVRARTMTNIMQVYLLIPIMIMLFSNIINVPLVIMLSAHIMWVLFAGSVSWWIHFSRDRYNWLFRHPLSYLGCKIHSIFYATILLIVLVFREYIDIIFHLLSVFFTCGMIYLIIHRMVGDR